MRNLRPAHCEIFFPQTRLFSINEQQEYPIMSAADEKLFLSIGLKPNLVKNFVKNEGNAAILKCCIEEVQLQYPLNITRNKNKHKQNKQNTNRTEISQETSFVS